MAWGDGVRSWPWRSWRARRRLTINLALQGGGAHGAYSWGVLDRLLEQDRLEIEGLSGTSAGALNAVVLASGWLAGGNDGARAALADLWRQIADLARLGSRLSSPLTQAAADVTLHLLSPYQLNPLGINPLRAVIAGLVDFERLRTASELKLLIAATNVRTGQARIFQRHELTPEAVLASACLPQLYQAVEIDGEDYWDGAFTSNPPVVPLVEACGARDVVLVQINPLAVADVPTTAGQIRNRATEIVFARPLSVELDQLAIAVCWARRPFRRLQRRARRLARHRLHLIDGSEVLAALDPASKVAPDWPQLLELRDQGRAAATSWLQTMGFRHNRPQSERPIPSAPASKTSAQPV